MRQSKPQSRLLQKLFLVAAIVALATAPGSLWAQPGMYGQTSSRRKQADRLAQYSHLLDGLLAQRQYVAAETRCREFLAKQDLSLYERSVLTIYLSESLSGQAESAPVDKATDYWQEARTCLNNLLVRLGKSSLKLPVMLQLYRLDRRQATQTRLVAELTNDEQLTQQAAETLKKLSRQLNDLQQELSELVRSGNTGRAESLSAPQLAELQRQVQFERAQVYLELALCFDRNSADRLAYLNQAQKLLISLAAMPTTHPVTWPARVLLVKTLWFTADYEAAGKRLEVYLGENPPSDVRSELLAQKLLLHLDRGQWQEALKVLEIEQVCPGQCAELDYAVLKTLVTAAGKKELQESQKQISNQRIRELLALINSHYSVYWRRKASALFSQATQEGTPADLPLLEQAAKDALASRQFQHAAELFDRAYKLAKQQGQQAVAFRLAFAAAAVFHEQGKHSQAMERFRRLALEFPTAERAAEAHLLALYHAGKLAATNPDAITTYQQLAEEHLERWPGSPTADEVRLRLGTIYQLQHQYGKAWELFRSVSPNSVDFPAVLQACDLLLEKWLRSGQSSTTTTGKPVPVDEVRGWISNVQQTACDNPNSDTCTWIALIQANLELSTAEGNSQLAAQLLDRLQTTGVEISTAARSAYVRNLLKHVVRNSRPDELSKVRPILQSLSAEQLFDMVESIRALPLKNRQQRQIRAMVLLDVLDALALRRNELGQSEQLRIEQIRADCLALLATDRKRLAELEALAQRYPKNFAVQYALAKGLLCQANTEPAAALAAWRTIEARTKPGSELWLQAKLALAAIHAEQGNSLQAERIMALVHLLYPDKDLANADELKQLSDYLSAEQQERLQSLLHAQQK